MNIADDSYVPFPSAIELAISFMKNPVQSYPDWRLRPGCPHALRKRQIIYPPVTSAIQFSDSHGPPQPADVKVKWHCPICGAGGVEKE